MKNFLLQDLSCCILIETRKTRSNLFSCYNYYALRMWVLNSASSEKKLNHECANSLTIIFSFLEKLYQCYDLQKYSRKQVFLVMISRLVYVLVRIKLKNVQQLKSEKVSRSCPSSFLWQTPRLPAFYHCSCLKEFKNLLHCDFFYFSLVSGILSTHQQWFVLSGR